MMQGKDTGLHERTGPSRYDDKETNMRRMFFRAQKWVLLSAAGSTFVLSGCDANVRDTVLAGVESASTVLTTTFLQAFFESLTPADEGAATVVKAFADQVTPLA